MCWSGQQLFKDCQLAKTIRVAASLTNARTRQPEQSALSWLCDWYIQTSGVRGYLDSARPRARRQVVVVATASQQPHPACEAVDEVSDEVTSA
jgi:hypothetical protein